MTETTAIRPRIEKAPLETFFERLPLFFVPILAILGLLAIREPSTWLTLTVAGLAMGMMIFIMASGLTLVFGLMDIINFGHGAFVTLGAFIGASSLVWLSHWAGDASPLFNLLALFLAIIAAMAATGTMGLLFERFIVRPVYGFHLKQILVTMGGLIVVQQLILVFWGPDAVLMRRPPSLQGSVMLFEAPVEKFRLVAVAIGLALFFAMRYVLARTRIGLLVRAGVENGEMVEALGFRIRRLFIMVFVIGSALAGLGGVLWGLYQESVTVHIGSDITTLVFIVIIIGGLGSVEGCFIGALLVGLLANYVGFLVPKLALVSTIGLMVTVLLWRPEGLFPVVKSK